MHTKLPTTGRTLAILCTPMYLLLLAMLQSGVNDVPLWWTLPAVASGAAVIVAVIGVFALKAYRADGPVRQFRLSSILLLIVPLALYLTYIRFFLRGPRSGVDGSLPFVGWIVLLVFAFVFVFLSTALLLRFAEAVMWLALKVQRGSRDEESGNTRSH